MGTDTQSQNTLKLNIVTNAHFTEAKTNILKLSDSMSFKLDVSPNFGLKNYFVVQMCKIALRPHCVQKLLCQAHGWDATALSHPKFIHQDPPCLPLVLNPVVNNP